VGKTIAHSRLRTKTGALVLAVHRAGADIAAPDPMFRLAVNDVLVVVGQPEQLRAATELLLKRRHPL
jgi:K+/H+ antiporter YhaU regulatory subunit KhtT